MAAKKRRFHRIRAAVAHVARTAKGRFTKHARRAHAAISSARRHVTRRYHARRGRRNPIGLLSSPAVRFGGAVLLGAGVGYAVERIPKPDWLPEQLPLAVVVGGVVGGLSWKFAKGSTRQYLIAGSIGCAGYGLIETVGEAVAPLLIGAAGTAGSLTGSAMGQISAPAQQAPNMATAAVAAANGI